MTIKPETIARLSARKGVRAIAVENFLGSLGGMSKSDAYANLREDTRSYGWNAATVKAISDGIASASIQVHGVKVGPGWGAMVAALLFGLSGLAHAEPMDRSLDRPVTRTQLAQATKAPAKAPTAVTTPKSAPVGVLTALCRDGRSYYHITGEHRGACAGAGGVASWADGSPVRSKGGGRSSLR